MATAAAVREALIRAIAETRASSVPEIEQSIRDAGGDDAVTIKSKFAEAVIARLETMFSRQLPAPADLDRTQFATIGALLFLLTPILQGV